MISPTATAQRLQGAATKVTLAHAAWDPDTHRQGWGLESSQGPSPRPQPALLISQVELRRPGPRSEQAAGVRDQVQSAARSTLSLFFLFSLINF